MPVLLSYTQSLNVLLRNRIMGALKPLSHVENHPLPAIWGAIRGQLLSFNPDKVVKVICLGRRDGAQLATGEAAKVIPLRR